MQRTKQISSSVSILPKNSSYLTILTKNAFIRHTKNSDTSLKSRMLRKSEIPKLDQPSINQSQIPKFIPRSRYYVQLSPSKNNYDLKGKSIESDKKSLEKIIDTKKVLQKAFDIQTQLRCFNIKSARQGLLKKIESLKTPKNSEKFKKTQKFLQEVKTGNVENVQKMLLSDGSLVNAVDGTKQTALHWACRRGYVEMVEVLVGFKASSSVQDMVGRTAEDIAQSKNCFEIVDFFNRSKRILRQITRVV